MRLFPVFALLSLTACPPTKDPTDAVDDTAVDTDTETDADTDADADTDTDADSDTDTDTDTDADTDTDTDTDVATCDGDLDGDGISASDGDCRPNERDAYPGASEECNGRDDDCDGLIDEDDACAAAVAAFVDDTGVVVDTGTDTGTATDTGEVTDTGTPVDTDTADTADSADTGPVTDTADTSDTGTVDPLDVDDDGDGYTENEGDCDDTARRINPRSPEICGNAVDENCDGVSEDCPESDTGVAQFYFVTDATVCDNTTFLQGHAGYELIGLKDGHSVCSALGQLYDDGDTPARNCPDCDWSFSLSLRDSTTSSDACADFGLTDGSFDTDTSGSWGYDWGFASAYYYDYAGTPVEFEDTVMLYVDRSSGWFAFSFNYGGRDWVDGDSYYFSSLRPAFTSSGGYAYYYYYR